MVYKIYNKLDQGNYNAGILPQKPINEFDFLPLVPIGDIQDPLIEEVLNTINAHKPQAKIALDKNNKANSNAHQYLGSSYETIPVEINPH